MSDCRFGVSPVNYPDPDPDSDAFACCRCMTLLYMRRTSMTSCEKLSYAFAELDSYATKTHF